MQSNYCKNGWLSLNYCWLFYYSIRIKQCLINLFLGPVTLGPFCVHFYTMNSKKADYFTFTKADDDEGKPDAIEGTPLFRPKRNVID